MNKTTSSMLEMDCGAGGPLGTTHPNYLDLRPLRVMILSQKWKGGIDMKRRLFLLPLTFLSLLTFSMISPCRATVVTFDDIPKNTGTASFLQNDYQGLVWSNFGIVNAVLYTSLHGVSGTYYGMVSASNVAFNALGTPAEIDSAGTNFNFLSAYLTGAWNSNLNIEVQGFNGGNLLYSTTVVASATSPTPFTFNYQNIDRLYFNSFGGQDAGFSGGGENFEMDNFTFEFVPEPSTFLLTGAGVLTLCAFRKRRRA